MSRHPPHSPDRRSQTETVGVVLLTGIIVISAATFSLIAVSNFTQQSEEDELSAVVDIGVTADNITVRHAGGDTLPEPSLELLARTSRTDRRYSFETDWLVRPSDGDDKFEPGEQYIFAHALSGDGTFAVVETEKNILFSEVETTIPSDGVVGSPDFSVRIDNTNSPVTEGETLTVRSTVTNTGDKRGTQTVGLSIDGSVVDSEELTLGSAESDQLEFLWNTSDGDAGTYDATVSSVNDSATEAVTVRGESNFNVTIDSTNSPVSGGTNLTVTTSVENDGGAPDIQNIDLNVSQQNNPVDVEELGLNDGQSRQLTLYWTMTAGKTEKHDATVASDDDSETTRIIVDSAAPTVDNFSGVRAFKINDSVLVGNLTVSDNNTGLTAVNVTVRNGSGALIGTSNFTGLGGAGSFSRTDLTISTSGIQPEEQYNVSVFATDRVARETSASETTAADEAVADANGPYTVDEGGSITLDGSGSNPQKGNPTYNWTILSSPGGDSIMEDTSSPNATYNAPANVDTDTDVTVELAVEDGGTTYTDTTTVTVKNVSQSDGDKSPAGFGGSSSASDIPKGSNSTTQTFNFTPNETLADGETVSINLDIAQDVKSGDPDPVDYQYASISSSSELGGGTASVSATTNTASVTYTANGDITAGTSISIDVDGVQTTNKKVDNIEISFTRSDGTTEFTTFDLSSAGGGQNLNQTGGQ